VASLVNFDWSKYHVSDRGILYSNMVEGIESQVDRIALLRGMYEGEDIYVVSCGPSLSDFPSGYLSEKLDGKVVFTIKQAFAAMHPRVDIHFFNCNNFTPYNLRGVTSVGSAGQSLESMKGGLWGDTNPSLFFRISDPGKQERCLCVTRNHDDWTLDAQPIVKPWGPGTIKETVLFTALHAGAKSINLIGVDLYPADFGHTDKIDHFYDGNDSELLARQGAAGQLFQGESALSLSGMFDWNEYLATKGVSLNICSKGSYIPEEVPRDLWLYEDLN